MKYITFEMIEKVKEEFAGKEQRLGGASFKWNKETGEFEVYGTNDRPLSDYKCFI
jgi:hypothetical protein